MQDEGEQPAADMVCRLLCGVFDCPVDLANHILGRGQGIQTLADDQLARGQARDHVGLGETDIPVPA